MIEKTTPVGIRVQITPQMNTIALQKAKDLGSLKNSITKGGGNVVAFLGEEIAKHVFKEAGYSVKTTNTYDHDFEFHLNGFEKMTIEIKSKKRTVDPLGEHNATIANFNTKQRTDFYGFVSVVINKHTNEYTHGYFVSLVSKEYFKNNSIFYLKGEVEPDSNPPFRFTADSHHMRFMDIEENSVFKIEKPKVSHLELSF